MVSDAKVCEIVTGAASLREAGVALVEAANDAGGRDNITVVLFAVEEIEPGAPSADTTQVEQPTGVGAAALRTDDVRRAVATAPAPALEPVAPRPETRAPRPPRPAAPPAKQRRWATPAKYLIVTLVVTAIFGSAAWIASRSVFFVGTNDTGFVTLYRGLPYELPLGLSLYQEQFETGVPAATLSGRVAATITEHKLRKQEDAVDLIRSLERGELAGQ